MKKIKKLLALLLATVVLLTVFEGPMTVQAKNVKCSTLYSAVKSSCSSGAKKVRKQSKCSFVTRSYQKKISDFYYATDSKQAYCVCIVKVKNSKDVKRFTSRFNLVKKSNLREIKNYPKNYSNTEKKVVSSANVGSKGNYVWYIALGTSSSANSKCATALKKKL